MMHDGEGFLPVNNNETNIIMKRKIKMKNQKKIDAFFLNFFQSVFLKLFRCLFSKIEEN